MTAAKIDPLEPKMHEVCRNLIAGFKNKGHCDAIEDFARKYPIAIFGELFGLAPQRREEFRQLAETWLHDVSRRQWAWTEIRAIIGGELEERRVCPKDDMLTGIALGEIDGELIDVDSGINLAATVFLGGLDTLPSNIGWTLRFLANNPGHRRRITEDPTCVPGAVEEFFRRFPSVAKNNCPGRPRRGVPRRQHQEGRPHPHHLVPGQLRQRRVQRPAHPRLRPPKQQAHRLLRRLAPLPGFAPCPSRTRRGAPGMARGHPGLPRRQSRRHHLHRRRSGHDLPPPRMGHLNAGQRPVTLGGATRTGRGDHFAARL